jgi:hypothetical protein
MSGFSLFNQVTETRTGPLGCSNYDNLDSVSSVLVQSPENKIQLQGKLVNFHEFFMNLGDKISSYNFFWIYGNKPVGVGKMTYIHLVLFQRI